jgi:UDP-N-acetylmuramate: L-alanyl-gamma-D-glutamyl-meso-diaminopimelate ligase
MILHVLNYHDKQVDYMVGAKLEGFDTMVKLTEQNDFIVLEGDEYLSSPIDRRPKFHLYKPNIALLSGIAWDHINVFKTFEDYVEQFKIYVDSIVEGGSITYNAEDPQVKKVVEDSENQIRKIPYFTPEHSIEEGVTYLETPEGSMPIEVFGKHNLSNLSGAKWICQHMGVDQDDFYEAIASFKGASKRLDKLAENQNSVVFKDFAHAPSKVKATLEAVKEQYATKKIVACLELHTYSSLNATFIKQYKDSLNAADTAVVFYTPEALKIKKLDSLTKSQIKEAFAREDLIIYTEAEEFSDFILNLELDHTALLLMSSGDYGGLDLEKLKSRLK